MRVGVVVQPIRFLRLEIERIGADQQRGHGAPLHGKRRPNVVECAAAGAQFVAGVVCFHVLRQVIELHIAARHDHLRFVVVFDVVGAQPRVLVTHVHVAVGVVDFPDLPLLVRFERGFASTRKRRERLLRLCLAP